MEKVWEETILTNISLYNRGPSRYCNHSRLSLPHGVSLRKRTFVKEFETSHVWNLKNAKKGTVQCSGRRAKKWDFLSHRCWTSCSWQWHSWQLFCLPAPSSHCMMKQLYKTVFTSLYF